LSVGMGVGEHGMACREHVRFNNRKPLKDIFGKRLLSHLQE